MLQTVSNGFSVIFLLFKIRVLTLNAGSNLCWGFLLPNMIREKMSVTER